MPFKPSFELEDAPGEMIRFILSPIMFPVSLGYGIYDYMEGTEHLDRGEALRNTGIWAALAVGVYYWNQYMYPGMYEFRTATKGFQLIAQSSAAIPLAMLTLAVVGTATQYEVAAHHGAGTRGSMGSVAPSYHLVGERPWWESHEVSDFYPWNW